MTAEDKQKLASILEKHGVLVGYLFGSAARGTMGFKSDIDVAVLFDSMKISEVGQQEEKLALSREISQAFQVQDADVINVREQTNPVLLYDAVILGEAILIKDSSVNAHLVCAVLHEYEDTRYLREISYRILRDQIKSGEFGRAPVTL